MIYTFLRGVEHRFMWNRLYWVIFKMVPCNCGITCYGNSKVRLACCASWCHVNLLGAVSFEPDRGLILAFLLPPPGREYKRGDVYDGRAAFFKKGKQHRVSDGRDPNRDVCDVTRQTGTYFPLVSRCQAEGVLVGQTVPSLSGVKEEFTGEERSWGTVVKTGRSGLDSPASRVHFYTTELWCHETNIQFAQSFHFCLIINPPKVNLNLWPW